MGDPDTPAPTNPTVGIVSVTSSFVAVVAFYFPLAILLFLLFCFLRTRFADFYYPRLRRTSHLVDEHPRRPPTMSRSFLGWVLPTMDLTDAKIYKACGVDVLVYIRFLRLCILFLSVIGVLCIGVVIPFNWTAEPPQAALNVSNYLSGFSMANVPNKSNRLYVHLAAVVVISALLCFLMWRAYEQYFEVRCVYQRKHAPWNYSIMCTEIRLSPGETLEKRFDVMFPGQILATHRTHVCEALAKAIEEKVYCAAQLARARESYQSSSTHDRPHHYQGAFWPFSYCFGTRVDSIEYYSDRIATLTQDITRLQASEQTRKTRVGFVTFKSRFPAMVSSQSVVSHNIAKWRVKPAPQPSDIDWINLQFPRSTRMYRTVLVMGALLLLIFFWAGPIIAVQGLTYLDRLYRIRLFRPAIDWLHGYPALYGVISGLLPSLVLIAFNAFLPDIIRALQTFRRFHLHSQLDRACLIVHYAFLVLNTLFVSVITGVISQSLLNESQLLLETINQLSATLPNQATFFMTYILLQGLITHLVDLVRPKDLIIYLVLRFWYCKTKEECEKAADMGSFPYSTRYAQELLIFTITLVYSVMSPPVLIVALLYYCLAYVVNRYNTIFVFRPHHESGGLAFPTVISCLFLSLLCFQLVMFGIFSVRRFNPGVLVLGLFIGTIIYWIFLHRRFYQACRYLPLECCLTQDEQIPENWAGSYCQPELKEQALQVMPDEDTDADYGEIASDLVVQDNNESSSVIVPLLRRG